MVNNYPDEYPININNKTWLIFTSHHNIYQKITFDVMIFFHSIICIKTVFIINRLFFVQHMPPGEIQGRFKKFHNKIVDIHLHRCLFFSCSIRLKYKVKYMWDIDLEDNVGNEQSLNILCFLRQPDSVSYVVRNVQYTISIA